MIEAIKNELKNFQPFKGAIRCHTGKLLSAALVKKLMKAPWRRNTRNRAESGRLRRLQPWNSPAVKSKVELPSRQVRANSGGDRVGGRSPLLLALH